ncbi:uncharacterized protein MONOS_810 [Monocercomonoides exilis]|uniref:uncharacterized protein n=1 Tax=Monocercomonoides exilis TaxID=2049356 RepID=UPI00355A8610|nr:hypothetical protein MONOS_810 [Monocercomonoides exilis]|eukprot:MONOS_810.1-p1 / transcript=MONOS_810.1 / gene=MONOS_810 / organism=Monocercomonoides_exilis_PA203 / gene_product=unspecified product / transcript_product=unspecified product / location=Mono_scaffold00013:183595-184051(+) / protein_length=133 / sequence_SO=supercontig / SO=protein_coding / is_pseudo=false
MSEAAGVNVQHMPLALQTLIWICCGAACGAVWGCCVCIRCGAFSDAFGSVGRPASFACSVGGHEVGEQADLCGSRCECVPFNLRSLDDEVMWRGVAVCEVVEIVEKGLWMEGMRMEDVVLSPATIVLEELEE